MENIYRKGGNIKFLCIHLDRAIIISEMRCPVKYSTSISAVSHLCAVKHVLNVTRTSLTETVEDEIDYSSECIAHEYVSCL